MMAGSMNKKGYVWLQRFLIGPTRLFVLGVCDPSAGLRAV